PAADRQDRCRPLGCPRRRAHDPRPHPGGRRAGRLQIAQPRRGGGVRALAGLVQRARRGARPARSRPAPPARPRRSRMGRDGRHRALRGRRGGAPLPPPGRPAPGAAPRLRRPRRQLRESRGPRRAPRADRPGGLAAPPPGALAAGSGGRGLGRCDAAAGAQRADHGPPALLAAGRPARRRGRRGWPGRRPAWRAVNTDHMIRAWSQVDTAAQPNVPLLDGRPLAPAAWAQEIRDAFAATYRFLLSHRDELLAPGGPLAGLAGCRGRLIFRPTRAYARLRDRSVRPDACRDAAARGGELEALARVYLDAPGSGVPATWPLLAAERRALEQGDIPFFHADLAGTVLESSEGGRIPGVIARPAVEELRDRLRALSPEDLDEQLGYIEAALAPSSPDPTEREKSAIALLPQGEGRGGGFVDTALD